MKIIKRNIYLNKLINVKDVPDIKVITGVRRAGKSKLMDLYNDYLNNDVSLEQSIALLNELNLPIEDGFSYQDTVYIKEKIVQ